MPDEITVSGSLSVKKGTLDLEFSKTARQYNMTGTDAVHLTQTIGTSAELLDLGDITTPGMVLIFNNDEDNYVTIRGSSTGDDLIKIMPQELSGPWRLGVTAPYAIANTAACQIEYLVIED